jgi:hypothetical protein
VTEAAFIEISSGVSPAWLGEWTAVGAIAAAVTVIAVDSVAE